VAGLIFYCDQTTLSNDRRVVGCPLLMSLANIACENRSLLAGHVLLAILPIVMNSCTFSIPKCCIILILLDSESKCIRISDN
jgi:hypothetical protein